MNISLLDPISPVSLKEKPVFPHSNSNNNRNRTLSVRSELSQSPGSHTGVLDGGPVHPGVDKQVSVVSATQEEKTNSKFIGALLPTVRYVVSRSVSSRKLERQLPAVS